MSIDRSLKTICCVFRQALSDNSGFLQLGSLFIALYDVSSGIAACADCPVVLIIMMLMRVKANLMSTPFRASSSTNLRMPTKPQPEKLAVPILS